MAIDSPGRIFAPINFDAGWSPYKEYKYEYWQYSDYWLSYTCLVSFISDIQKVSFFINWNVWVLLKYNTKVQRLFAGRWIILTFIFRWLKKKYQKTERMVLKITLTLAIAAILNTVFMGNKPLMGARAVQMKGKKSKYLCHLFKKILFHHRAANLSESPGLFKC